MRRSRSFAGGTLWHTKRAADQALQAGGGAVSEHGAHAYQNVADTLHAILTDADALAAAAEAERAAKIAFDLAQRAHARTATATTSTELAAGMAYQQAVLTRCRRGRRGSATPRRSIRRSAAAGGIGRRSRPARSNATRGCDGKASRRSCRQQTDLVIEDDAETAELIAEDLQERGYIVSDRARRAQRACRRFSRPIPTSCCATSTCRA